MNYYLRIYFWEFKWVSKVISLRKLRRCLGDSCLKMFKFFKDENDPHLYFPESTTFPNLLVRGAVVASKNTSNFSVTSQQGTVKWHKTCATPTGGPVVQLLWLWIVDIKTKQFILNKLCKNRVWLNMKLAIDTSLDRTCCFILVVSIFKPIIILYTGPPTCYSLSL